MTLERIVRGVPVVVRRRRKPPASWNGCQSAIESAKDLADSSLSSIPKSAAVRWIEIASTWS